MMGLGGGMDGDAIVQFAMMNKISTGNSMIDVLLCMVLPLVLRQVFPWVWELWERIRKRDKPTNTHDRHITYTHRPSGGWGYNNTDIDREPPNHLLHAAILLYLNKLPLAEKLNTAQVQLRRVRKERRDDDEKPRSARPADPLAALFEGSGAGDGQHEEDNESVASWSSWCRPSGDELLEHLGVSLMPPADHWVEIEPGLKLQRCEAATGGTGDASGGNAGGGGGGDGNRAALTSGTTHTIILSGATAEQVDGFIANAWACFREERRKKKKGEKEPRWLYMPVPAAGGDEAVGGGRWKYKRYKLSDDKTFASLFHPEKHSVMDLLDAFTNKRGKFAIQGYPQKLGFLLWGPPGTGKTSFIKALATQTNRSIMSISLARVRTNQELMDMMFDQVVDIEGSDMPEALPFSKCIFIFEDVDACSDVVSKRSSRTTAPPPPKQQPTTTTTTTEVTVTCDGGAGVGGWAGLAGAAAGGGGVGGRSMQRQRLVTSSSGKSTASAGERAPLAALPAPHDEEGDTGGRDQGAAAATAAAGDVTSPVTSPRAVAAAAEGAAGGGDAAAAASEDSTAVEAMAAEVAAEVLEEGDPAGRGLSGSGGIHPAHHLHVSAPPALHLVTRQESLVLPDRGGGNGGGDGGGAAADAAAASREAVAAALSALGFPTPGSPRGDGDGGGSVAGPARRPIGPAGPGGVGAWMRKGGDDALNLAGLLNVLDGVVDTPGRIVVMTSNHPERLDPALIRPGRINKKIYMGNIGKSEAEQMVAHWFGPEALSEAEIEARFRASLVDGILSPATLEGMCAEHETISDLVTALETHAALAAARAAAAAGASTSAARGR